VGEEHKRQPANQQQGQQEPTTAAGKAAPVPVPARPSEKAAPVTPMTVMHMMMEHRTTSKRTLVFDELISSRLTAALNPRVAF
jgi:hypothetical protein